MAQENSDLFNNHTEILQVKRASECGHETESDISGLCENCAQRKGISLKPMRGYQNYSVQQVFKKFNEGLKSVCLCLPTGAGKTRTLAEIVGMIFLKRYRENKPFHTVCLSHRGFLKLQMAQALEEISLLHGKVNIIKGKKEAYEDPINMVTIQTLARRLKADDPMPPADLVVVDECHRAKAEQYKAVLEYYTNQGARVIGLTATPVRLDKKPLNDVFETLVVGVTTKYLIKNGYLVRPKIYAKYAPDLKGVRTRAGDYSEEDLELALDTLSSNTHVLEEYKRLANGKIGIFFCCTVAHSLSLCKVFNDAGIPSEVISGNKGEAENTRILNEYREGKIRCIFNCEIATEGFDFPSIEVCGLIRPTKSLALYLQMIGRSLRISPGKKEAIILDHSGNVQYHGKPDDIFPWEVYFREGYERQQSENPFKQCPNCFALIPKQDSICEECGYSFARVLAGGHTEKEILDLPLEEITEWCAANEVDETRRILIVIGKARKHKAKWFEYMDKDLKGEMKKAHYLAEFFRNIIEWESQNDMQLNPTIKAHIVIAQGLDNRKQNFVMQHATVEPMSSEPMSEDNWEE